MNSKTCHFFLYYIINYGYFWNTPFSLRNRLLHPTPPKEGKGKERKGSDRVMKNGGKWLKVVKHTPTLCMVINS